MLPKPSLDRSSVTSDCPSRGDTPMPSQLLFPPGLPFPQPSPTSKLGNPYVQIRPTTSHPPDSASSPTSRPTHQPSPLPSQIQRPSSSCPCLAPTHPNGPGHPGGLWTGLPASALAPTVSCPQSCGPFRTCLFCSNPAMAPISLRPEANPPHGLQGTPPALGFLASPPSSLSSLCYSHQDRPQLY